jgi:hypothetical protein
MKVTFITFVIFLICSLSFAQLSVKNNTYVFVDGDGFNSDPNVAPLFVTDDVRIESTGNIYLRNEAQLIQGIGTTGNSGTGKLSVYQEGTVDNFAYNHWSSPVGEVSTDNTTNSSFIATGGAVLNDVTGLTTSDPALIGSSANGTSAPLTISKLWLYGYNPGTQYSEWDFLGNGAPLDSGYGFSMKGSEGSDSQQYEFAGKANSGDINVDVLAAQYTLIGNPYPSALNIGAFIHDPDNSSDMKGTILIWEHDPEANSHVLTQYVGGYASYTVMADGSLESYVPATFSTLGDDGFPSSGAGTSTNPAKFIRQYLPVGQGFMIEGAPSSTGSLTFKNEHRVYYKESGSNSQFFKTESKSSETFNQNNPTSINEINYNEEGFQVLNESLDIRRFRLNVDFNDHFTRQLLHNFHPTATPGFDYGLESNNSYPYPRDAYFIAEDIPYITQAHGYDLDLKIPLVLKVDADLAIRVRIYDVQNFNDEPIFLHDKETDVYYDLRTLDFNINLSTGTYTDRFEVTFKNANTLNTDQFLDSGFAVFQNNNTSQLILKNPKSLIVKSVSLIDVSGKEIFNKINLGNSSRQEFSTKNLSDGVYIASVTLDNNNTTSKKVVITNK